jgi:hypothetical protein
MLNILMQGVLMLNDIMLCILMPKNLILGVVLSLVASLLLLPQKSGLFRHNHSPGARW